MKLLNSILLIIILAINVNAQDCPAKFSVSTDYNSTFIYLNNKLVASGKLDTLLAPGKYFLLLDENVDKGKSKTFRDTIFLKDCQVKILDYRFHTGMYLKTDPEDVYVMKNDSLIGHTPLFINGRLGEVILTKPGYEQKSINLMSYDNNPVSLKFTGPKSTTSFFESNVFKIFVSSIVVLGGITAYYKIKADKRFDDYQATGDGALLNETRKYDLISGISFAALQVNFGFLIYYFLKD